MHSLSGEDSHGTAAWRLDAFCHAVLKGRRLQFDSVSELEPVLGSNKSPITAKICVMSSVQCGL